jgi:type IV secretion system protein VirD4
MLAARSPLKFGYRYDLETDTPLPDQPLFWGGETHVLVLGVNGAGKSTRFLIENLVTMRGSFVVLDIKGELAAQTMRARRLLGDLKIINPYNMHHLGSDGFNPLAMLDPDDDEFFDKAKELTLAIIEGGKGEDSKNEFFTLSSRGWFCAGIMWEVQQARLERRVPSLLRAREWCLQPEEFVQDGNQRGMVKGVPVNARRMVAEGGRQIANLAARFAAPELSKSDRDVIKTLDAQTEFLISNPIARDLEKGHWSFDQLKQRPTAVYVVLPPNQIQDKRGWTRLLITCALHAHLKPGPLHTWFIMDEFRVSVGQLPIINDFWALVRGFGVQFMPICQSITQLRALFAEEWENYAGQAGAVVALGAPGDTTTAEWMSKRSGTTTIWKQGWNSGQGQSASGLSSNEGENYSQIGVPLLSPNELMSMPRGTGIIWLQGMGDECVPFAAPNWWQRAEIAPLVDESPYRPSDAPASAAPAAAALLPMPDVERLPGLGIAFALGIALVVGLVAYGAWQGSQSQSAYEANINGNRNADVFSCTQPQQRVTPPNDPIGRGQRVRVVRQWPGGLTEVDADTSHGRPIHGCVRSELVTG